MVRIKWFVPRVLCIKEKNYREVCFKETVLDKHTNDESKI
jgi:hypothetical protein